MFERIFVVIFSLAILLGIKNLTINFWKRIKSRNLIIAKGMKKLNYKLIMGILYLVVALLFLISLYRYPLKISNVLFMGVAGVLGIEYLIENTKIDIREDGIYYGKKVYKWNYIDRYEWSEIKVKKVLSLTFYTKGKYSEKIMFDIAMEDKEKVEKFLIEIGLK